MWLESPATIDEQTTGGDWKSLEVDLSPYAGREVNLVVRGIDDGNQPYTTWKRLAIE